MSAATLRRVGATVSRVPAIVTHRLRHARAIGAQTVESIADAAEDKISLCGGRPCSTAIGRAFKTAAGWRPIHAQLRIAALLGRTNDPEPQPSSSNLNVERSTKPASFAPGSHWFIAGYSVARLTFDNVPRYWSRRSTLCSSASITTSVNLVL